jgi:hypothetical protein
MIPKRLLINMPREYTLEQHLVSDFLGRLVDDSYVYGISGVATEFFYQSGCTDVVVSTVSGQVIAFEAKLDRWQVALNQAYRNRCFAHQSFVVLPERTVPRALSQLDFFVRHGIGIVSVSKTSVVNVLDSKPGYPIFGWLTDRARSKTLGGITL